MQSFSLELIDRIGKCWFGSSVWDGWNLWYAKGILSSAKITSSFFFSFFSYSLSTSSHSSSTIPYTNISQFNTMSLLTHFSLPTRRAFRTGLLMGTSGFLTPAIMHKCDVSVLRAVFYVLILYTMFAGCEAFVYRMVERKDVEREDEGIIKDQRKIEGKGEKVNEKPPLEIS